MPGRCQHRDQIADEEIEVEELERGLCVDECDSRPEPRCQRRTVEQCDKIIVGFRSFPAPPTFDQKFLQATRRSERCIGTGRPSVDILCRRLGRQRHALQWKHGRATDRTHVAARPRHRRGPIGPRQATYPSGRTKTAPSSSMPYAAAHAPCPSCSAPRPPTVSALSGRCSEGAICDTACLPRLTRRAGQQHKSR